MLSKKELDRRINQLYRRINELTDKQTNDYFRILRELEDLSGDLKRLSEYLGVEIERVPPHKRVRKKDE